MSESMGEGVATWPAGEAMASARSSGEASRDAASPARRFVGAGSATGESLSPSPTLDFQALFEAAPDPYLVLAPNPPAFTILAANDAYLRATMTTRETMLGRDLFTVFPDNPADPDASGALRLRASLEAVLQTHEPDTMAVQKYDIRRPAAHGGGFEERYWSPMNTPVLDAHGAVIALIHHVQDVTEIIHRYRPGDDERQAADPPAAIQARHIETELTIHLESLIEANNQLRAANAAAEAANRRLRAVLEVLPVGVGIADAQGAAAIINPAYAALWGGTLPLPDGIEQYRAFRGWRPGASQPLEPEEWASARALLNGEVVRDEEIEIETFDGQRKTVLTHAAPIRDETGAITVAVVVQQDITERTAVEQALRESEERFRATFAHARAGLALTDMSGRFVQVNPAYCALTGYSESELSATSLFAITHPEDRARNAEHVQRMIDGEIPGFVIEKRYVRKDGDHVWVQNSVFLVRDAEGRPSAIGAVVEDITARKQVENALVERLGQLEATFESMVDGVAIYDSQGRIVRLNTALRELLALDETYTALPVVERVPSLMLRDGQRRPLPVEQTPPARVARGEIFTGDASMDMRAHTLDGREVELNVSGAPVRDAEGRIVGGVCVYRDVTARHQSELAVRESEENFRTLADNIPTLCWMAYPDGNIFWYNQRWYDYTGATPESQEGWGWESVHDPAILPAVLERWKHSIATGEDFEMVFPLRGADGVFRPFLTRIIAVKDERGDIVRWFGTNVDITEQRASEEALRVANQVKEEFLSVASHELRTPLTSIMPNVQLAARQVRALLHALAGVEDGAQASPEDMRQIEQRARRPLQLIENTERQVKRLSRLVDDLLDVSRIQTGKLELRLESCDLMDVAREAVHEQRAAWPGRRITLDLPRRGALAIHCDADRIGQVLTNYLTNALKYSPEDQPVAVRVRAHGRMARVEVRDHGPGLTEEQRARLFERFYRVPGIEQQSGSGIGLGLGLYICQSLVERHGGQVGVESAPGEGSTFWFAVPLLTAGAPDDSEGSAAR